jgi:hypothetical protein
MVMRSVLRADHTPPPPRRTLVLISDRGALIEGLGKLKDLIDFIGNGTHDFPACSILPQATTLPRVPLAALRSCVECLFDLGTSRVIPAF